MGAELLEVALLVRPAGLVARHEVAQQPQAAIVALPDMVDGGRDLHDALRAPVRRLQRHDDPVAGAERGVRDEGEPRRTVKDDEVIQRSEARDRIDERVLEV